MKARWRRCVAPEYLFAAVTVTALSPYLFWWSGFRMPAVDRVELTYLPALLWTMGLVSFILGARIAKRIRPRGYPFRLASRNIPILLMLAAGIAFVLLQVYFVVDNVYGVFPLLDYLSPDGSTEVGAANLQEQNSGFGQIGLLTASLYILNPLVLLLMIDWLTWRRGSRAVLAIALPVIAFAHLINAKRQGVYSGLFYLIVGLSIYTGNLTTALTRLMPWRRSRLLTRVLLVSTAAVLVVAFGYIASIRTRGRVEASPNEILSYLQYPLINFEAQCGAAGVGPAEFSVFEPLQNLLPAKYISGLETTFSKPPRIELSSPAGIYETIHWYWGPGGIAGYSLLLGFFARYLYDRSRTSMVCLLAYCYVAVALLMAHSNNQTLILVYVPIPLVVVWLLRFVIATEPAVTLQSGDARRAARVVPAVVVGSNAEGEA